MAESALQRLLRLKKEKENGSSTLAEIQRKEPEIGEGTSLVSNGINPIEGGTLLSEEGIQQDGSDLPVSSDSELVVESVVVPEVISTKPMSAMDRLRALKSGGSSNANVADTSGNSSITNGNKSMDLANSGAKQVPVGTSETTLPTPKIIKPRATHPIAMEMAELEAALDAQVPGFVSILSQIHKKLRADPDVVTLLDDEEIGVIVAGLEKHTNVTIVAPSAIKAAKSKAKKEPVSAMDL